MFKKGSKFFKSLKKERTSVQPLTDRCRDTNLIESKTAVIVSTKKFWLYRKKCHLPCFAWILMSLCYLIVLAAIASCVTSERDILFLV